MLSDKKYMRHALLNAQKAFDSNEVPVGAVIVDQDGIIIGCGYNTSESNACQVCHAEIESIRAASEYKKAWRLDNCTMYITLEPCLMCFGAITLSRIQRLVYATRSERFGVFSNKLYEHNKRSPYGVFLKYVDYGVCEKESRELLQLFFKKQRV